MKDMEKVFEQIEKEIAEMKKSVTVRDVEELLKENGVVVNVTTCTFDGVTEMNIGLDFTEHDKVFEDKIAELEKRIQELEIIDAIRIDEKRELKQRIAELESKETETSSEIDTSTPINCANSLISHLTHLEAFLIAPERYERTFDIDDLEQIAEHLLVYCKHNKENE